MEQIDFSQIDLENLSQGEKDEIAELILGMFPDDPDEAAEVFDTLAGAVLASVAGESFSLEGFRAFFEFMNGFPLHAEGEIWAENIFLAIKTTRKLLQEAFRGSGKTTVISKYFLAYYIGHHPWTTNMIVRVNTQKARETALEVATLIESDKRWGAVFADVVPDRNRGWGAETGYYLKKLIVEGGEENYSAWLKICSDTARPSGPTFIGYGYDSGSNQGSRTNGVLLIDDIHDKENTKSERQLAEVKRYVKEILLPIPVPDMGIEIWNFTPWLTNDAYAERKETGRYVHSKSPVMTEITKEEAEALGYDPESTEEKPRVIYWSPEWQLPEDVAEGKIFGYPFAGKYFRLAWPDRWDQNNIARIFQDILIVAFARMYALDLKATEGLKLRGEWLHRFPSDQIDSSWQLIAGIDYASVVDHLRNKDRDYFAMAIGALIPGGGIVLFDGVRKHVTLGQALNISQQICQDKPQLSAIGVESIGKGEEFYAKFRLADDIFGNPLPIFPITSHSQSKGKRFEEYLGPRFQFSRIWVTTDEDNDFIKHFINEWLSYPNNVNDDCLDAVYMMALMADPHLRIKSDGGSNGSEEKPKKKISPIASGFGRR